MLRIAQIVARNIHLTFNKKFRDVLMQIFGHEGLIANHDTADIAHCTLLNEDFYRLNVIRWEHIALRKLLNPFKWLEFLIVAPLELASWSLQRGLPAALSIVANYIKQNDQNTVALFFAYFVSHLLSVFLSGSFIFNIATNLVVWAVQLILAPARTIVRPLLQLIKNHPKTAVLIGILAIYVTLFLALSVLTGALSLGIFSFIASSTTTWLIACSYAAVLITATLTKATMLLSDLYDRFPAIINKPSSKDQMMVVDARNLKTNYPYQVLTIHQDMAQEELDELYDVTELPVLIFKGDATWIYGQSAEGSTQVIPLRSPDQNKSSSEWLREQLIAENHQEIYYVINRAHAHVPNFEKQGSTAEILTVLSGVAPEDAQEVHEQNEGDTWALFLGVESLTKGFFSSSSSSASESQNQFNSSVLAY